MEHNQSEEKRGVETIDLFGEEESGFEIITSFPINKKINPKEKEDKEILKQVLPELQIVPIDKKKETQFPCKIIPASITSPPFKKKTTLH